MKKASQFTVGEKTALVQVWHTWLFYFPGKWSKCCRKSIFLIAIKHPLLTNIHFCTFTWRPFLPALLNSNEFMKETYSFVYMCIHYEIWHYSNKKYLRHTLGRKESITQINSHSNTKGWTLTLHWLSRREPWTSKRDCSFRASFIMFIELNHTFSIHPEKLDRTIRRFPGCRKLSIPPKWIWNVIIEFMSRLSIQLKQDCSYNANIRQGMLYFTWEYLQYLLEKP